MKSSIKAALCLAASTLLVSAGACNTTLGALVRRGDDALARGDRSGAIVLYREACRLDAHSEACGQAEQLAQAELQSVLARAELPCTQGPVTACLETLAPARRLAITSPALTQLLTRAAERHVASCDQGAGADALALAAAEMACLLSPLQAIDLPTYSDHVRAIGRASAASFVAAAQRGGMTDVPHAADASDASTPSSPSNLADGAAARWAFLAVAQCFDPQLDAKLAHDAFARAVAVPIAVGIDTTQVQGAREPFAELCPRVAEKLGGRARCTSYDLADQHGLAIDAAITMVAAVETATTTVRSLDYIAGTEVATNPYFEPREHRYRDAQRAFQAIEQEASDRRVACDTYRTQAACAAYSAILPTYQNRQRELNDAAWDYGRTPTTYVRDVRDTFRYELATHRWNAPWSVTFSGDAKGTRDGVAWYTDSTHVGFDRAQLGPDPLVRPTAETLKQLVAQEVLADLVRIFDADLTRSALAEEGRCATTAWDPSALACWARVQHLAAKTPDALAILTRAGHAATTCL